MNRRTALSSLAALTMVGCTGEAVYAQAGPSNGMTTFVYPPRPMPDASTEVEVWANPSAHGALSPEHLQNELLRLTAEAVKEREVMNREETSREWRRMKVAHCCGLVTALRLTGYAEYINEAWADRIIATLGKPLSTDATWLYWPGGRLHQGMSV